MVSQERLAAWRDWWRLAVSRADMIRRVRREHGLSVAASTFMRLGLAYLRRRLPGAEAEAPGADLRPLPARALEKRPIGAVLFIGYVEASLGLGESLRGLIRAAAHTGLPFSILPYRRGVEERVDLSFMPERHDLAQRYAINLVEIAPDQIEALRETIGSDRLATSYNILRTYWELPRAPDAWREALAGFDEIWAPTRFVADAVAPLFSGPITVIPPAIEIGAAGAFDRAHFGLDAESFVFLFSFDFHSYPTRKNPLGVIEAFRKAFPEGEDGVRLVLKWTTTSQLFPEMRGALQAAAQRDPRIVIVESTLSRAEFLSLLAVCDCYVSLHRSEGLGLGMIEAMALGRPVIGTAFSGSDDFLSEETGFPVPYTLRRLRRGEYLHHEGQSWAEPDLAEAASAMRRVRAEPELAAARAQAGRAFVSERYGIEAVGRACEARLRAIAASIGRALDGRT